MVSEACMVVKVEVSEALCENRASANGNKGSSHCRELAGLVFRLASFGLIFCDDCSAVKELLSVPHRQYRTSKIGEE